MEREEIINLLREYGLNRYEASVYLTLLELGEGQAKGIASNAGVPLQRIYGVLESLERKGIVKTLGGKPKIYAPVEPNRALENLIKLVENGCFLRIAKLKNLKEELLKNLPQTGLKGRKEKTEILVGLEAIKERAGKMLREAKREIKIAGEKPLFRLGCQGALAQLIPKGVALKVIGRFADNCKREIEAVGGEYRERNTWCNYLLIVDNKKLLNVYQTSKGWEALYTEEKSFIKPFSVAFDVQWKEN